MYFGHFYLEMFIFFVYLFIFAILSLFVYLK